MKKSRIKIYVAAGLAAVLFLGIYLATRDLPVPAHAPNIANRAGEPRADSEFLNTQKAIEFYQFEARENPDLVKNHLQLAQLYLQQARITGRHHEYVALARQSLDEVLKRDPDNLEGMLTRASMLMTLHRFQEALNLAEQAVRRAPHTAMAWGILSDARKELGDYSGAVEACDKMLTLRPDLRSYARAAHLREIHGDLSGAKSAMKLAAEAGIVGLENHAWSLYQLGNLYLHEGKIDTAETVYAGILMGRPNYGSALSGLARVRTFRGNHEAAIQLLLQANELAPEHGLVEQLVDAYLACGRTETAKVLITSVLDAFKQHEKQGWNVNLEFAEFCVKHDLNMAEALRRIEQEYQDRPDNIDVLQTYAWILLKRDRTDEALQMIRKALRLNTKDSKLFYRAGAIAAEMQDFAQAKVYLEKARALKPILGNQEKKLAQRTLDLVQDQLQFSKARQSPEPLISD